jgi:hypothetical protein
MRKTAAVFIVNRIDDTLKLWGVLSESCDEKDINTAFPAILAGVDSGIAGDWRSLIVSNLDRCPIACARNTPSILQFASSTQSEGKSVDYTQLIKRIVLPTGFAVPATLTFEDIVATALSREHLREDVAGINASLDLIRHTRGGGWPTEAVTEDGNFIDLVWHECEFREGRSFSYAAHAVEGEYLGCCYFYPLGTRTTLSDKLVACDVDVSWWVTPSAYERGYYEKVFRALQHWGTADFPFSSLHFSNHLAPS